MVLKSDEYFASKLVNPQKSVQTFYVPSRSNVLLLENRNGGIEAFLVTRPQPRQFPWNS